MNEKILFGIAVLFLLFSYIFFGEFDCVHGYGYIEECIACQQQGKGYSICSGACLNNCNNKGCSISNTTCCYNTISYVSATGMQCNYKYGLIGFLIDKHNFYKWRNEMANLYC